MVNTLQFYLSVPTPYVFMRRFLKAAQSDKKVCLSGPNIGLHQSFSKNCTDLVHSIVSQAA